MESLVIIVIFALISMLGNGKKRNPRPQQTPDMTDMPQQTYQAPVEDNPVRHRRPANRQRRAKEQECGYCTGDIVVEASVPRHVSSALNDIDKPCVDIEALQKQWGLSDLQNALMWQEILDKPLAARRRGLR